MSTPAQCPKCSAWSGDHWGQCEGECPMPCSPHYVPNCGSLLGVSNELNWRSNVIDDNGKNINGDTILAALRKPNRRVCKCGNLTDSDLDTDTCTACLLHTKLSDLCACGHRLGEHAVHTGRLGYDEFSHCCDFDCECEQFVRADQPPPVRNHHPEITALVHADLDARRAKGVKTYGTTLQPFNGRDALRDAYEEALDQAQYLRQAIYERDHAPKPAQPEPTTCPECMVRSR